MKNVELARKQPGVGKPGGAALSALLMAAAAAALGGLVPAAGAAAEVIPLGSGSYLSEPPPGAPRPPSEIFRTGRVKGPVPTNDWWSSLAWLPFSERQFPHPLAVQAQEGGLRVAYPGRNIHANLAAVWGTMPGGASDLVIGHAGVPAFEDARLDGFSDWFVTAAFGSAGGRGLKVTYGHGSPFVFARTSGGAPQVTFGRPPEIWSPLAAAAGTLAAVDSPGVAVVVNGSPYALFGPPGSKWSGTDTNTFNLVGTGEGEPVHLTVALLPEKHQGALAIFRRAARNRVEDSEVSWRYDPAGGAVETTFALTLEAEDGDAPEGAFTLFALYPHQWRHLADAKGARGGPQLLPYRYPSVRGEMRLASGRSFKTRLPFPGVLPALPPGDGLDRGRLAAYVQEEVERPEPPGKDTYWDGKHLGRLAALIPLAEQAGADGAAEALHRRLKGRLEGWLEAGARGGRFAIEPTWGALVGYPSSYGSAEQLNDHSFHYGYFLRAAAEVARRDPAWAAPGRWGGMVDLLIQDIACPARDDERFPFLRNFDPYAGHSWASGHAKFADGNNCESSSEAMNAWTGLVLWGALTGDKELRDLGAFLYANELAAVEEYWFDVHGENHPPDYPASVVTMVWGGKGANGTWFSANPEAVHGINWLPFHGGSLYLGRYPAYARENYRALVAENKLQPWDAWADLVMMYQAVDDPAAAAAAFERSGGDYPAEAGNSRANTYHWIRAFAAFGHVDREVTADHPLSAVFRRGRERTYVAYNPAAAPLKVTFSDGFAMDCDGAGFTVQKGRAR